MTQSAMKPPTCAKDQPSTLARKIGTLTTNHTSRAANNASRASDRRLMPVELERMPVNAAFFFACPIAAGRKRHHAAGARPVRRVAITDSAPRKPSARQQQPADEEAGTLQGILRSGQHGDPLEQTGVVSLRHEHLDRALRAHLREVLRDARERLAAHHVGDGRPPRSSSAIQEREQPKRDDLKHQPKNEREPHARSRREPPADEVRDDAEELVEQEQERELDGRVAELVEMQQDEHPERAVGERERPVRGGDDRVVADADASARWPRRCERARS